MNNLCLCSYYIFCHVCFQSSNNVQGLSIYTERLAVTESRTCSLGSDQAHTVTEISNEYVLPQACRSRATGFVSMVLEHLHMQIGIRSMFFTAVRMRVIVCGCIAERAFGNAAVINEFVTKQVLLARNSFLCKKCWILS
jgi:hypothetical protein